MMKIKASLLYLCVCLISASAFSNETTFEADKKVVSLNEVWKLTLQNNENVEILQLNNFQAKIRQKRVLSQLLPDVRAQGLMAYSKKEKVPDTYPVVPNFFKTAKVIASQTLYDGRILPESCSLKYNLRATREQGDYQVSELLFAASAAYLKVLQNEQLVAVGEKQLELAKQLESVTRERYDAGEAPKTDLLRASVEVARSKRELFTLENAVRLSREELSSISGTDLADHDLLVPDIFWPQELDSSMDQLVVMAWTNRKDIKSLESRVQSRMYELKSTKRGCWPRLSTNAEYQLVDPDTLTQRNNFWTAALRLDIPIFDRRETLLNIQKVKAQLKQDQLELERMRKDVEVQVADSWLSVSTSKENLAVLAEEVVVEEENYRTLNKRYQHGQATNIDLTDAFQRLIAIKAGQANEGFNLMLSSLRLYKDIGIFDSENLHNLKGIL